MENRQVADLFDKMADLLEFQQENPFRVRAYRNGARRIRDLRESLSTMVAREDDLTQLEGIGKDLAEKITTLVSSGSLPQLEQLLANIPESVLALLRVPGLGPKKAALLYHELGVDSLTKLRQVCEAEEVRQLKGFGAKTEEKILAGIAIAEKAAERIYWAVADELVQAMLEHLRRSAAVRQVEPAGSYRRGVETVGDIDLLVDADDATAVMEHWAQFPEIATTIARGSTKMSVRLHSDLQVDLRVVPHRSFGAALQYFTGSKAHNVTLRGRAKARGLKMNEWGVFRIVDAQDDDAQDDDAQDDDAQDDDVKDDHSAEAEGEYLCGATEVEVYAALDLPCYPPELRENREEFAYQSAEELPQLVTLADLRGDLHMHTTATDGKHSLREMADAARALGYQYIAITDHSQRVSMANGLDAKRLQAQWQQIDRLNAELDDIVLLKGIECDILERGGMDLPDDVLAQADWVIASLHYGQHQSQQQITDRLIGAVENRWVSMVAHPTGRLINRREPYAVDLAALFQAASENGKLLELNANPARLDLNEVHCAQAQERGIPIVINSDAHSVGGLSVLRYGVLQARRGGLTAADVANTRSWPELQQLVQRG